VYYFAENYIFTEANIYNVDETGISAVQKPGRILGPHAGAEVSKEVISS
jgi:hypothetical protein